MLNVGKYTSPMDPIGMIWGERAWGARDESYFLFLKMGSYLEPGKNPQNHWVDKGNLSRP